MKFGRAPTTLRILSMNYFADEPKVAKNSAVQAPASLCIDASGQVSELKEFVHVAEHLWRVSSPFERFAQLPADSTIVGDRLELRNANQIHDEALVTRILQQVPFGVCIPSTQHD